MSDAPQQEPKPAQTPEQKDIEEHKMVAVLSYVSILFLVPLLTAKESKFAQFHAKQGLVMFVAEVLVSFVSWIPVFGWAAGLIVFFTAIYALLQTLQGQYWEIPYIGKYAKEIKI